MIRPTRCIHSTGDMVGLRSYITRSGKSTPSPTARIWSSTASPVTTRANTRSRFFVAAVTASHGRPPWRIASATSSTAPTLPRTTVVARRNTPRRSSNPSRRTSTSWPTRDRTALSTLLTTNSPPFTSICSSSSSGSVRNDGSDTYPRATAASSRSANTIPPGYMACSAFVPAGVPRYGVAVQPACGTGSKSPNDSWVSLVPWWASSRSSPVAHERDPRAARFFARMSVKILSFSQARCCCPSLSSVRPSSPVSFTAMLVAMGCDGVVTIRPGSRSSAAASITPLPAPVGATMHVGGRSPRMTAAMVSTASSWNGYGANFIAGAAPCCRAAGTGRRGCCGGASPR